MKTWGICTRCGCSVDDDYGGLCSDCLEHEAKLHRGEIDEAAYRAYLNERIATREHRDLLARLGKRLSIPSSPQAKDEQG